MAPFRWWIIAGVLLSFATTGASVGLIAVSAYLISKAALVTDTADLNVIITGVRFFAISRTGCVTPNVMSRIWPRSAS